MSTDQHSILEGRQTAVRGGHSWWQTGIIYQIYPRSWQDSNGDGIGDLAGIAQRLDHLSELGVDAVWISPFYPSPMRDFGYDVSDYRDIDPMFGTMADFERLVDAIHERGMRLILDLVPNHTSDQHPWFLESGADRDNPKRDWYIWADGAGPDAPPNNWLSVFGGPAWSWDETSGQYYLHSFTPQQPDLNYRNPAVLEAMLDVMKYWLDKGIDGFRVDVIDFMVKDARLRDDPPNPDWRGGHSYERLIHRHSKRQPEVHDIIRRMRQLVDRYGDKVLIGEVYIFDEEIAAYYGRDNDGCHLPFNFRLIEMPWTASDVRDAVISYEAILPEFAWPNWVLGNHDKHRLATRVGAQQARVAAMLLLTLRGTPTIYYGEEIGMVDAIIAADQIRDPCALNQPEHAAVLGRDPERSPMQWDDSPNAGFTDPDVQPWLPLAPGHADHNVAAQTRDPGAIYHLYRALIRARRSEPALTVGDFQALQLGPADAELFAYTRSSGGSSLLVVLNFGAHAHQLDLSAVAARADILIASDMRRSGEVDLHSLRVGPNEGLVLRIDGGLGPRAS